MKSHFKLLAAAALIAAPLSASGAIIYEEDFDPPPGTAKGFASDVLFDSSAYVLGSGNWLLGGNATTGTFIVATGGVEGNALQPNTRSPQGFNSRFGMTFISAADFGGAGTYTLSFDMVGDTAGGNAQIYVATAKGFGGVNAITADYAGTASSGVANAGSYGISAASGSAATTQTLIDETIAGTTTGTLTRVFTLDGTEGAVAISFGSVNSNVQFDNISIVPEPGTLALTGLSGLLLFLRRRGGSA
ncbi:MAG: PEP-CTERM sorting domain-containing protein [Planctomycetota bacterium]